MRGINSLVLMGIGALWTICARLSQYSFFSNETGKNLNNCSLIFGEASLERNQDWDAKISAGNVMLLVVEDHPIVISGCRALFAEDDGVVMIEARTAAEAREAMQLETPDVSVIDINLPDGSGLELTREFVTRDPTAKIVVFSMSDTPMLAIQAIECGAKSYVSKNGSPLDLKDAVLAVARGDVWIEIPREQHVDFAFVRAVLTDDIHEGLVGFAADVRRRASGFVAGNDAVVAGDASFNFLQAS